MSAEQMHATGQEGDRDAWQQLVLTDPYPRRRKETAMRGNSWS